jgi:hypothetical protein
MGLMDLLKRQTGKEPDELQEFADMFNKLAEKGGELGINFKALVDEDTGESIEIADLAMAVAERTTAIMADRGMEVPDDMVEVIAGEIATMFPAPEEENEMGSDMPTGDEMKTWIEKSVSLIDDMMDVRDDVTDLTNAVEPLVAQVAEVAKGLGRVERQLRARRPASGAKDTIADAADVPEHVVEQLKEQIAAEIAGKRSGPAIVPDGAFE